MTNKQQEERSRGRGERGMRAVRRVCVRSLCAVGVQVCVWSLRMWGRVCLMGLQVLMGWGWNEAGKED